MNCSYKGTNELLGMHASIKINDSVVRTVWEILSSSNFSFIIVLIIIIVMASQ